MNTISYFEIQSSEPEREIKFYTAVFGWKFVHEPNMPIEFYHIQTVGIDGALIKRPAAKPDRQHGTNAFTNLMLVANFNKTRDLILNHGGTVAMKKFAVPGQRWQGYFLDPDNNVFGIFQVDEDAV